jgi:serine/threonine protein kinase
MRVAVKILPLEARAVNPLRREAALHAPLAHENVVRVFGYTEGRFRESADPVFGIVFARLQQDLGSVLAASASAPSPSSLLPMIWRLRMLHELTSGLAYLHAHRIVHGDLRCVRGLNLFVPLLSTVPHAHLLHAVSQGRSDHVLLDSAARGGTLQLSGLGALCAADSEGRALENVGAAGSPSPRIAHRGIYTAPELVSAAERPTFQSDIFSWSILAWQVRPLGTCIELQFRCVKALHRIPTY